MQRTWLTVKGKPMAKTAYQERCSIYFGLADQSEAVRKVRDGKVVFAEEIQEIVLLFEGCSTHQRGEFARSVGAKRVSLQEFLAHILRGEDLPDWESKVR